MRERTLTWVAGAALLCLAVVAGAWFVAIAPQRDRVAALGQQRVDAEAVNDRLRVRIAELRDQFGDLAVSRGRLEEIGRQLPATPQVPQLVRAIDAIAASAGVAMSSLTPGTPEQVVATTGGGAAAAGTASTGATGAAASGSATTGAGTTSTGPARPVVAVPVSVVVSGDYFQMVTFLRQLQVGMPRAFLVDGLQVTRAETADKTASTVQTTISGRVFTMPDNGTGSGSTTSTSSGASSGASTGSASGAVVGNPVALGTLPSRRAAKENATW